MNQIAPIHFASDPYFHDIIREMEAIFAATGHRIRQLPLMRENFTV